MTLCTKTRNQFIGNFHLLSPPNDIIVSATTKRLSLLPRFPLTGTFLFTMHNRRTRRNNQYHNNGSLGTSYNYNYNNTNTDYESDTAYLSDMPTQPPPPLRSNEELNLSVCRRHNPEVTNILSLANYAVIYTFSPATTSWEKINIEGTLFVCQLSPGSLGEERYTALLLNRRGLNNFDCPLTGSENVELTDEFVILKQDKESNPTSAQQAETNYTVYGIWIYSEPNTSTAETRTINAKVISDCAARAGESLKEAKARVQAMRQDGLHVAAAAAETQAAPTEELQGGLPMGRTMSLKDLFGQQRAQDDGFSVRAHHEQPQPPHQYPQHQYPPQAPVPGYPPMYPNMPMQPMHQQPGIPQPYVQPHDQTQAPAQVQPKQDILGDLFRRAGLGPQQ
ncbi:Dcp1-like decapping [Penicillium malachiteum]|uniref:Dcp1-like decapping n=1 Tax=Penicillium malachiteum TaxID=1324776 RepID=A0AAD6MTU0_9EURO|nr:Dcp1-like decapping [Penicillium malachiteum]